MGTSETMSAYLQGSSSICGAVYLSNVFLRKKAWHRTWPCLGVVDPAAGPETSPSGSSETTMCGAKC